MDFQADTDWDRHKQMLNTALAQSKINQTENQVFNQIRSIYNPQNHLVQSQIRVFTHDLPVINCRIGIWKI